MCRRGAEPTSARRRLLALLVLACVPGAWSPASSQVSADRETGSHRIDDRVRTAVGGTPADRTRPIEVDLQQRLSKLPIRAGADGLAVTVETPDGPRDLSPEEYVEAIRRAQDVQRSHGWLYVVLNITSPAGIAWIAIGFLGQALFTFRMVLQWLASEKHKRSVVPVGFWWGSLLGGLMLFVYFVWRKDVVGIVGQSTGVFVYARNLVLIYRRRSAPDAIAPAPEPT
jgi:lipid-A-disaccharide synthase-like uncharacterized protein